MKVILEDACVYIQDGRMKSFVMKADQRLLNLPAINEVVEEALDLLIILGSPPKSAPATILAIMDLNVFSGGARLALAMVKLQQSIDNLGEETTREVLAKNNGAKVLRALSKRRVI